MSAAKEQIVRVAIPLFAERGYAGTSVAEIQQAAGLSPGSGAMYKHFRSKQEVLAAAIDWHINDFKQAESALELPADPLVALKIIMTRMSEALLANAQLIRITFRDLDARPELADRIAEDMLAALHGAVATWLAGQVDANTLRPHDTEAMAAVLLSAISYYRVVDILLGRPPAVIEDERLIDAVVDLVGTGLTAAITDPVDRGPVRSVAG
jgi:AcrR family transcriptional regulator